MRLLVTAPCVGKKKKRGHRGHNPRASQTRSKEGKGKAAAQLRGYRASDGRKRKKTSPFLICECVSRKKKRGKVRRKNTRSFNPPPPEGEKKKGKKGHWADRSPRAPQKKNLGGRFPPPPPPWERKNNREDEEKKKGGGG